MKYLTYILLFIGLPLYAQEDVQMLASSDTLSHLFSPLDLGDSLIFWLDPQSGVDSITNTTASDGDKVRQWRDRSPNAHLFYQATAASRPNFRANQIAGYPALEFRYGQNLQDTLSGSSADRGTLFIVMKLDHDSTTNRRIFYDGAGGGGRPYIGVNSSEVEIFFSTAGTRTGSGSINAKWIVLEAQMANSTSINIVEDGASTASGTRTAGEQWWGGHVALGQRSAEFSRFYVAEVIGTTAVVTSKLGAIRNYLNKKYDLY